MAAQAPLHASQGAGGAVMHLVLVHQQQGSTHLDAKCARSWAGLREDHSGLT
jgi:hypothetical protein